MTLSRRILTTLAVLLAPLPLTSAPAYAGGIFLYKTVQHLTADPARLKSGATAAVASTSPTLTVTILGSGAIISRPAGIACPIKCTATFSPGTTVVLRAQSKSGTTFAGWGGSCTGNGACSVKVSALVAVAAQFVGGQKAQPQPATNKYVAVPGPYSGSNGQAGNGYGITFYVAPGGRSMQDISIPVAGMSCTPAGGPSYDHLVVLQLAINPNGSFGGTTAQEGILDGGNARFTYTIAGRFQPATSTASASAAGTWKENIRFATGTTASCTSNQQSWTATLFREPPWQRADIRQGNYSGSNGQAGNGYGIKFSVTPGGSSILNVSIPVSAMNCMPSGGPSYDHVTVGEVAIAPGGSFSSQVSQDGTLDGSNVKITYTLAGYFVGLTPPAGAVTVAGIWREDIKFASGATTMCTSNDQLWTATIQS
jgi:hypothetical protein